VTTLHRPEGGDCGAGVLVLAGSSGAVEDDRARLLAAHGATALALRWFGGPEQQPGPFEVPLETFVEALDLLAGECDRLAVLGASFGAEAALLVAARDARVRAVVAVAPSPVVWAGVDEGRQTSHWTHHGRPLDFVPFDESWTPHTDPPAYRSLYARSLAADPAAAERAAIPVEQIDGEVLVVGGEDDQVWPGADFARAVADRRTAHGRGTRVLTHARAGHRVTFPGETAGARGRAMARGGTPEADAELGAAAWPHVVEVLHLRR
jgi:dienelactone hydrolase